MLERLALGAARWSSSSLGFSCAALVVVVWLASGPALGYSDTWQLVINTGTTIVTFLMVFLIQRSQNKDALAIQLKLDEFVAALAGASNELVAVESSRRRTSTSCAATTRRSPSTPATSGTWSATVARGRAASRGRPAPRRVRTRELEGGTRPRENRRRCATARPRAYAGI